MLKSQSLESKTVLKQSLKNDSKKAFSRPRPNPTILSQIIKAKKDPESNEIGCTDSSDGLYQAISDLAYSSECTAVLDYQKIRKHKYWPIGDLWDKYYFFGGEDYELIFSLPKEWAKELMKIEKSVSEIGFFKQGKASVELINFPNDNKLPLEIFSHF